MSDVDLELREGESLMTEQEEVIYRQVTKHMITPDGQVGSHAFGAMTADRGMPSYARSSVTTAQDARVWHTANANSASLGVWGVSVGEVVLARKLVVDDSGAPLDDDDLRAPGHCFIDYRNSAPAEIKAARAVLLRAALSRGEFETRDPSEDIPLY